MNKSVLVMNTPENCKSCIHISTFRDFCRINCRDIKDISTKPDWCPLRPLPEKFDNEKDRKLGDFEPLLKIGWNACIDAFAGGNIDD